MEPLQGDPFQWLKWAAYQSKTLPTIILKQVYVQNKKLDWKKETDRMGSLWKVWDQPTVSGVQLTI